MYRKSSQEPQFDIFGNVSSLLTNQAVRKYNDKDHWHNQFRQEVVTLIDEDPYKVLFNDTMGAPNASIRILLGMMILKEGFVWSDSQLFEQCHFNLLIRGALGLVNMSDAVPAESTYYLFRRRIYEYHRLTGIDLVDNTFAQLTSDQIKQFDVNGHSIRMDSKLIGSNIAYYTRYEVIHQTLHRFYKTLDKRAKYRLAYPVRKQLEMLMSLEPGKTVYSSTKEEIQRRLESIGLLIYKLLNTYTDHTSEACHLLQRVFDEQYKVVDNQQIQLRPKEEISAGSLQSPHDPDSTFRHKGNQKVKGYSVNVTETSSDESLNLITNVMVVKSNTPDTEFVQQAIKSTTEVTDQTVEKAYLDGAYQSPDNDEFCKDIDMVFTGIQGKQARYDLEMTPQGLTVTDTRTGEQTLATLAKKNRKSKEDRWFIVTPKGKYYFNKQAIRASQLRKTIENRPIEETRKRNNVEATIFQLSFPLRNNKTKYRGRFKNQVWACCRCFWINLVRIINYIKQTCQRTIKTMKMPVNIELWFNEITLLTHFQLKSSSTFSVCIFITFTAFFSTNLKTPFL
jgi:hypothetical protein